MTLTKFRCMVCGRVTDPQPEYGDLITGETIENDICNECKEAVQFAKEMKAMCKREMVKSIRTVAKRTFGYCPSCGRGLDSYHDGNSGEHITRFCYNCGQAVKWE